LAEVARRLEISKVVLSVHSAAAHRKFGIKNRAQSHGGNFKEEAALPAHTDHDQEIEEDQ
jgi:hypothetical protein